MSRPNYSNILKDINFKKNRKKFLAIRNIERRMRAASEDRKVEVAASMINRIMDGRTA